MKTLKKNIVIFFNSLPKILLVLLGFFIASLLTPNSARAQAYCASSISLDVFNCKNTSRDPYQAICDWHITGSRVAYSCTADPNNCWTTGAACTSNDSSVACYAATLYDGTQICMTDYLACSQAQCWAPGDPPCPSGQQLCGSCINACRDVSTTSCYDQIVSECGGPPTPPPPPPADTYGKIVTQVWIDNNNDKIRQTSEPTYTDPLDITLTVDKTGEVENLSYPNWQVFAIPNIRNYIERDSWFARRRYPDDCGEKYGGVSTECTDGGCEGCRASEWSSIWNSLFGGEAHSRRSISFGATNVCDSNVSLQITPPAGYVVTTANPDNFNLKRYRSDECNSPCGCFNKIHTKIALIGIAPDLNKMCIVNTNVSDNGDTVGAGDTVQVELFGSSRNSAPEPVKLTIARQDYTQMSSPPAFTTELNDGGRYYYEYANFGIINGSFENGLQSPWTANDLRTGPGVVDSNSYPSAGIDGRYYLDMKADTCNNGSCQAWVGETSFNCPLDCGPTTKIRDSFHAPRGMNAGTLCVLLATQHNDAERLHEHSHAERGNETNRMSEIQPVSNMERGSSLTRLLPRLSLLPIML